MGFPSSDRARYSSPAHSAATGPPAAAKAETAARRGALADSSGAYTSGNPPPITRPPVPSGSASSRSGSKVTTSAPAAVSSSACSAYENVNAGPPATATTGRPYGAAPLPGLCPGPRASNAGDHGSPDSGGAVRASAISASRSQPARTCSASAATAASASACRSATGTSPRWREGVATCGARRRTPSTGIPASSRASRSITSCRSEPTLFRITPPSRTCGSKDAKPCTSAATDRDCEDASTTSTTGARSSFATCAVDASSPRPAAPS